VEKGPSPGRLLTAEIHAPIGATGARRALPTTPVGSARRFSSKIHEHESVGREIGALEHLAEAVREIVDGDARAFRKIVLATSPRLVRLAARIMGNVEDGEDVVQEAYVKAYRAIVERRFDGRSRVETWLYRIVTNTAIDALRNGARRPRSVETLPEPAWDGAAAAEARVALRELELLLAALPPDQRAAIVLKSVEGLSAAEIAEIMETSEGAVEQRLVRARAALKQRNRSS
jgi:RNA polymerase sigma-70 factor (ECF subfamily)